jgi:hypothetical protein
MKTQFLAPSGFLARTAGRVALWTLAIVAWSVLTSSLAWAQPEGRGGPGGMRGPGPGGNLAELALQKSVTEELKLTSDQTDLLKKLAESDRDGEREGRGGSREERRKKRQEAAEAREKKVAEILEPGQLTRLKQISWQVQGARAFSNAQVTSALSVTSEQEEKIQAAQQEGFAELGKLFRSGAMKEGDSEEVKAANRAQLEKVRKATMDKIVALLTSEQQTKWKELIGQPFTGKIEEPPRGDRERRRGRD